MRRIPRNDLGCLVSLRSKVLLLLLGVTISLVASLALLSLLSVRSASETARTVSRSALEAQASDYLIALTTEHAKESSLVLERTRAGAQLIADFAGQVFSQPTVFSETVSKSIESDLARGDGDELISAVTDTASTFVPSPFSDTEQIEQTWKLATLLDPLAWSTLRLDKDAASVYLSTEDQVTRMYPKLDLSHLPSDFRITEFFFYSNARPDKNPERNTTWSRVYDDLAGQGLLVSAIAPVYTNTDAFIGIVGIDFKLSDLAKRIESINFGAVSYSFLIDGSGRAIAFPAQAYRDVLDREPAAGEFGTDLNLVDGPFTELFMAMRNAEQGFTRIVTDTMDKYVAYSPVEGTDWSLGTVIAADVVFESVAPMHAQMVRESKHFVVTRLLPFSLLILVVVTLIGFFLTYRFLAPLRQLTEAAHDIGRQNWDTPLPTDDPNEVGLLAKTIRGMADQLRDLINNLEQRVETRTSELQSALNDRERLEKRFRLAFQSTPIGMGLVESDGEIIDANPALTKMLGAADVGSSSLGTLLDLVVNEERDLMQAFLGELSELDDDDSTRLFDCELCDGQIIKANLTMTPVRNDGEALDYFVLHVHDVTETHLLTRRLETQANYDDLTGLLNRRAFDLELEDAYTAAENGKPPSYLLYADLDQFKVVNDTSGHTAGDELLKRVSDLMKSCVRSEDIVSRTGGDEFAFILHECPMQAASKVSEKIRAAVEEFRFNWGEECYRIGISIGAVPVLPTAGTVDEIQQMADGACYKAKEGGRNQVHVVEEPERSTLLENRGEGRWAQRLREAMDKKRFVLYGQLIQSAHESEKEDGRAQIEVLLRMRDPIKRRLITPGAFLPAAERYGLSTQLDLWVVKSLLDTLFVYQHTGTDLASYWVNLSGASVGDARFGEFLLSTMATSPLPRGTVNFEITETAVIRNIDAAQNLIASLQDMGCMFALDDFGKGLSSFAYLKKLPIDRLKIDGMFVRDIVDDEADRLFVKSIIDIAHSLNLKTTAEFVENESILNAVRDLGVDYVQGFGIHRPELLAPQFPGVQLLSLEDSVPENSAMLRHAPPKGQAGS